MKETIEKLQRWIFDNKLDAEFIDEERRVFKIGSKSFYLLLEPKGSKSGVFSVDFSLKVEEEIEFFCTEVGVSNYCFYFGNSFYFSPVDSSSVQLNILKYVGLAKRELDLPFSFLGVHGKYEVCNGVGHYFEWAEKSRFLGITSLGIAEESTLAGTLVFQSDCKKKGIKPIIGETVRVTSKSGDYVAKCYVISSEGWRSLLLINKSINVDNVDTKTIPESTFLSHGEGVVLVIGTETVLSDSRVALWKKSFSRVFFQLDLTEYRGEEKEKTRLLSIKRYLLDFKESLEPILIQDAYYLDKEYCYIKKVINKIGSVGFQFESKDQWFKSIDEIFFQWQELFSDSDERLFNLLIESSKNTIWISDNSDFEIETGTRHLPDFEWGGDETNEELFQRLIKEGLERLGITDNKEYLERLEREIVVIRKGNVVDYFLILWDIVEWCKTKNILTGVGRGSAAGSLLSYVLGITGIDPLEYGLLFERFLNEGRVLTSLPDIDLDFEGKRREEVKRYMEDKYGLNYVCSVGTYGTFRLKSAIRDIGKQFGLDGKTAGYILSQIGDDGRYVSGEFIDIFNEGSAFPPLKEYILKNPQVIEFIRLVLRHPKNTSVHACATLILPKKDQYGKERDIFSWIPVKSVDGVLVSEWEGGQLEDAGFLKEDILGIKQLDKFSSIFSKVEKNRGKKLDMSSVDINDKEIFELFRKGLSADVFHFGSKGLTSYAQDVLPNNIEDMIAMLSLYRPGPIESNAHLDYVKCRLGEKEPEYDFKLKGVTEVTYGLYAYQEQVMLAVQQLGGMDLVTADSVRKAMGKMDRKLIKEYQDIFIKGAIKNGCDEIEALTIWNKLAAFAKYGFNKSHAAAYSYTGLMCQWLKVKFPIEFWTTSFEFAEDKEIPRYVSEINKLSSGVSIVPPDINKSSTEFISDSRSGKIYWAINKIKFVGDTATDCIINEREESGDFFSIEEFFERVEKRKVNKRVVENLILAGCFDQMYNIEADVSQREGLLREYYTVSKTKPKEQLPLLPQSKYNWYWTAKQKSISGLGYFNLESIITKSSLRSMISKYIDPIKLQSVGSLDKRSVVAGIISESIVRKTRKGEQFCSLTIECNDEVVHFLIWPDKWGEYREEIESSSTKMFIGSATIHRDNFKNCNVFQSDKDTKIEVY